MRPWFVSARGKDGETEARVGRRGGQSGLRVHVRPALSSLGDGGMRSVRPVADSDLDSSQSGGGTPKFPCPLTLLSPASSSASALPSSLDSSQGSGKSLSSPILKNNLSSNSPPLPHISHTCSHCCACDGPPAAFIVLFRPYIIRALIS